MTFQDLVQQLETLNADELKQLAIIIQLLQQKSIELPPKKRTLGLGQSMGNYWITPDFDEPLFPDNWMDDPSDPLNWNQDKKDTSQ